MPVIDIPNQAPSGWTPGTIVGVDGGIEQYLPGGANERTTLRNVVTEFGVDNTGVADVSATLNASVASLNNGEVFYFPYGLYRFQSNVALSTKRITVRGDGEGVLSTSSITIGTGTKVFTVAAGLGWTASIGIRIWHVQDRWKWMQGTVTSYSGTTLTVSIDETSGDTDTLALWTIGQTTMIVESSGMFSMSGGTSGTGETAITGSPSAGDTVLTVSDGSGLVENSLGTITILEEVNGEVYHNHPDPRGPYTQYNWITDVTGNTVTLARPLPMDLPVGRTPLLSSSAFTSAYLVGFEYFAAFGEGTVDENHELIDFSGKQNCWLYHTQFGMSNSYTISVRQSVGIEIAYSYIGETYANTGPSAASLSMGGTNSLLLRHSIIKHSMTTEGYPDFINAHLYCLGLGYRWTINHGAGSRFRLYEGCIVTGFHADGYHGGTLDNTIVRCQTTGDTVYGPYGWVIQNRFSRRNNVVGNVLGQSGFSSGNPSWGNPNGGNGANDGTTVYPALYVSSGGVSGSQFRHVDPTGDSRLTGVIASNSGTKITITLDSPNTLENALSDPQVFGGATFPFHVVWGTGDSTLYRLNCTIVTGESSGANIVIEGSTGSGTAFPADSTAVAIKPGEYGYQELDGSVEATNFYVQNYVYDTDGAPGSIANPTADTVPDSLAYASQPTDWPGSIVWPPAIDPENPDTGNAVIPAQVFYNTGEWPGAGNTVSTGISGLAKISGTVTI